MKSDLNFGFGLKNNLNIRKLWYISDTEHDSDVESEGSSSTIVMDELARFVRTSAIRTRFIICIISWHVAKEGTFKGKPKYPHVNENVQTKLSNKTVKL